MATQKFQLVLLALIFLTLTINSSVNSTQLSKLSSAINIFDNGNSSLPTTIKTAGPDVTRAKRYVYLTGASYCPNSALTAWNCTYCKTSMGLGYTFSTLLFNQNTNTLGIITINKKFKEIVVTFRGTYNVPNVVADVTLTEASPSGGGSGSGSKSKNPLKKLGNKIKNAIKGKGKSSSSSSSTIKVHNGFLKATKSLYPQLVKKLGPLIKENKGYSVVISGHSLGAAMGSIALYLLQQNSKLPKPASYSFFGFGTPRVGNQAYADYFNKQGIQMTRTINKGDIVGHIPAVFMGYLHHGNELWISPTKGDKSCSKSVYEDSKCSNSLGPVYSAVDHLFYWDVAYLTCAFNQTIPTVEQVTGLQALMKPSR